MAITWSWLMPAPSTLYTQRDTLNYTAFAIASAAVSSRPKCPARTAVFENHIGRVLENQYPVQDSGYLRGGGHYLPG